MVAMSSLRIAACSPSLLKRRFQDIGGIPTIRIVAAPSPARPHARLLYAGEVGAMASLRVGAPAVCLPLRFSTALLPYMGSASSRFTAAAPGLQANCLPPHLAESPPEMPTTPEAPYWWWGRAVCSLSSVTTKRPLIHVLAVLLLSGFNSTGFKPFVDWAATTLHIPPRYKVAILLGANAITMLFHVAVMGKDVNDVCSYLMTHGRKVQEGKSASSAPL